MDVPVHNVSWLPDGFMVRKLADTGVAIIDNFCTAAEAQEVIDIARDKVQRSRVLVDGKFEDSPGRISETAMLFGAKYRHDSLYPLMQRASMLVGIPYTHLEDVYVTRYGEGGLYNEHLDFGDEYQVDRLYTVLLYLNSVPSEQGGATVFPKLNAAVQPKAGRAVTWTNKNPDGSGHYENSHAAYPVKNGGEKWVIQFWFRRYQMVEPVDGLEIPQARQGRSIDAQTVLPDGVTLHQ
jgi:prolyl 4-hydroxylase